MNLNNINGFNEKILDKNLIRYKNYDDTSFDSYLKNALNQVNSLLIDADNQKKLLATGQVDNIHEVMIAAEKADIALQFTLNVRNKVIDSYKEIMRMQI